MGEGGRGRTDRLYSHLHAPLPSSFPSSLPPSLSPRHEDVVVLDYAYHGHTGTMIDISPYKHHGNSSLPSSSSSSPPSSPAIAPEEKGGEDERKHGHTSSSSSFPKKWVHVIPSPDTYRGPFTTTAAYVSHSSTLLDAAISPPSLPSRHIAAFFAEGVLACGGQVRPPPSPPSPSSPLLPFPPTGDRRAVVSSQLM